MIASQTGSPREMVPVGTISRLAEPILPTKYLCPSPRSPARRAGRGRSAGCRYLGCSSTCSPLTQNWCSKGGRPAQRGVPPPGGYGGVVRPPGRTGVEPGVEPFIWNRGGTVHLHLHQSAVWFRGLAVLLDFDAPLVEQGVHGLRQHRLANGSTLVVVQHLLRRIGGVTRGLVRQVATLRRVAPEYVEEDGLGVG